MPCLSFTPFGPPKRRSAFTLVELSVVLVVIGLLVAGALAAQDMMRAATIRNTVTDVEQYKQAIILFEDKYGYLPGDLPNATDFWSTAVNGDGNRSYVSSPWYTESFQAWTHLKLADMLKVEEGTTTLTLYWGHGEGWYYLYTGNLYSSSYAQGFLYGEPHVTITLSNRNSDIAQWGRAVMDTGMASQIDTKMDDGLPASGKVYGEDSWDPEITTNCIDGSDYNLDETGLACRMMFIVK